MNTGADAQPRVRVVSLRPKSAAHGGPGCHKCGQSLLRMDLPPSASPRVPWPCRLDAGPAAAPSLAKSSVQIRGRMGP